MYSVCKFWNKTSYFHDKSLVQEIGKLRHGTVSEQTNAISDLRETNMSETGLKCRFGKSTNSAWPLFLTEFIHSERIWSTLSCLVLQESQFDRTCLFACTLLHRGHAGLAIRPHRTKLAAVASCCCRALRTNRNI